MTLRDLNQVDRANILLLRENWPDWSHKFTLAERGEVLQYVADYRRFGPAMRVNERTAADLQRLVEKGLTDG